MHCVDALLHVWYCCTLFQHGRNLRLGGTGNSKLSHYPACSQTHSALSHSLSQTRETLEVTGHQINLFAVDTTISCAEKAACCCCFTPPPTQINTAPQVEGVITIPNVVDLSISTLWLFLLSLRFDPNNMVTLWISNL